MSKPSWCDDSTYIGQTENEETHVTDLYARKCDDGEWEYAAVYWRYHVSHVIWRLKGAKLEER